MDGMAAMMFNITKDKYYHGVWCIADMMDNDAYEVLYNESQAKYPWTYQPAYAEFCVYYCVVLMFVFIVKRLLFRLWFEKLTNGETTGRLRRWFSQLVALNRYISYRRFPAQVCNWLGIPSSAGNFLVVCATFLYVLCYTFIPKVWYRGCRGFGSPPLAVRAGLEATALVPFILMLSGKTNIITQLTGISYEKLNVHHRWLSTLVYILTWVHIIPFYIQPLQEGGVAYLKYYWTSEELFRNGVPPTVFLTWLCFGSYWKVRQGWYELFLHLHWLCGIGFCISLYIHAYPALMSQDYLYATVALWGSQVLWRLATKTVLKPGAGFAKSRAVKARKFVATGDFEASSFELKIDNKRNDFKWTPGQHVFLRFPGLRILDNHPFSICNHEEVGDEIKLLIKPRKGLTKKIFDSLADDGKETELKVFLDGPYGGMDRDVDQFTNLFLFATGTGISAVLPFLTRPNANDQKRHLVWVVSRNENLKWIESELDNLGFNDAEIDIYVSHDDQDSGDESGSATPKSLLTKESTEMVTLEKSKSALNVYNFKPDLSKILPKQALGRKSCFVCSGSDSMKTSVGNCVASLQSAVLTQPDIEEVYLHTESFDW